VHTLSDGFQVQADTPEHALDIAETGDLGDTFRSEVINGIGHQVFEPDGDVALIDTTKNPLDPAERSAFDVAIGLMQRELDELDSVDLSDLDGQQEAETLKDAIGMLTRLRDRA
jgi:hypothetical protein